MPKLHMGHEIAPYARGGKTTDEVSKILEDKYGVMNAFFAKHVDDLISPALEGAVATAIDKVVSSKAKKKEIVFGPALRQIEKGFRSFLDRREMDNMGVRGVPTAASLKGAKERASFVDTGLYRRTFKAWIE